MHGNEALFKLLRKEQLDIYAQMLSICHGRNHPFNILKKACLEDVYGNKTIEMPFSKQCSRRAGESYCGYEVFQHQWVCRMLFKQSGSNIDSKTSGIFIYLPPKV